MIVHEQNELKKQAILDEHHQVAAVRMPMVPTWFIVQRRGCLLLNLPISVLILILRWILMPHPGQPLILPDAKRLACKARKPFKLALPVLRSCKLMFHVSQSILYGDNSFTAASPSASYYLDDALGQLKGWQRQLITSITLQIDWGDELWAKLPLIAVALHDLKKLSKLEILLVAKLFNEMGGNVPGGQDVQRRKARSLRREGNTAEIMLKAEKKTFKDMVNTMKTLRVFRLVGFVDEEFARLLELQVSARLGWGMGHCII